MTHAKLFCGSMAFAFSAAAGVFLAYGDAFHTIIMACGTAAWLNLKERIK